jgi:hypothetical protein
MGRSLPGIQHYFPKQLSSLDIVASQINDDLDLGKPPL